MVRLIYDAAVTVIVADPDTAWLQPATEVALVNVYVVVAEGVTVTVELPEPLRVVVVVALPFQ